MTQSTSDLAWMKAQRERLKLEREAELPQAIGGLLGGALEYDPAKDPRGKVPLEDPRAFRDRRKNLGIPERFWNAKRSHVPAELPVEAENLLLLGKNGVGKSYTASALAIEWGARFCSVWEVILRVRSTWGKASGETEIGIYTEVTDCRVLVLDDLWAGQKTDFGLSWILGIVEKRGQSPRLKTVVTCDRKLAEIDKFDSSLASRLAAYQLIKLEGKDRRLELKPAHNPSRTVAEAGEGKP